MMSLAATQLLSAGSGAQGYKTPGNSPGLVTLPPAAPMTVTVQMPEQHVILNGDVIASTAQHQAVAVVNQAGDLIQQQASG